ncbi:MAG: Ig-like domain-containing protein, partial [Alphaproteobacteria bacterium]
ATVQATGPQAGLVHPVAPGTTRIVARNKATGIANTDGATEVRARGVSLSVEPSTLVLPTRLGFPMRCYVNRADGSRSNITEGVSWSSSSPSVAVSQSAPSKGVVQASVESEATIDCTDPLRRLSTTGVSGARVTVAGRLVGLSVEPDPLVLGIGETRSARVIGVLANGGETSDLADAVDWSIAPTSVATVATAPGDRGEVTGVAAGTATLRATEPTTGITSTAVNDVLVLGAFASLVVDADEGIVGRGETLALQARATWPGGYSSDLTEKCTWSTSPRSVATVTNTAPRGRLSGIARGDVVVTADCPGGKAAATVRVAGDVVGLRVSPASWQGEALGDKRFKAIATYEDGHERDASDVVAWTSSAPARVDFDPAVAGSARLLEAGPAVLTATHPGGRAATASVLVTPGIVVLEILPTSRRLHGSDFARLRAQGRRSDGTTRPLTKQVTWSSDDERIARVGARPGEIGMIFGGNRLGTTSVRATLPGSGFAAAIPVTVDVLLESFELIPAERTIPALATRIVEARGRFTDGSIAKINRSVVYATSDPAVAVVSNEPGRQGEVTAIAPGKAAITAVDVSSGKAARNALSVTVTPP